MKKLIKTLLSALLVALLFSCQNPANSNSPADNENETENNQNSNETVTITAGWYLYTTNANSSKPQKTYFYMNETGAIERAGNSSNEYTGQQLELLQQQLSYTACKKNADGTVITFTESAVPSWADEAAVAATEYLNKLYGFLYDFKTGYDSNRDATITFSNLDSTIRTDENNKKYITCTLSYENNSDTAVEAFEKTYLFSDSTSGTINNARIYFYPYWTGDETVCFLINVNNTSYKYICLDDGRDLIDETAYIEFDVDINFLSSSIEFTYWKYGKNTGTIFDYDKKSSSTITVW